MAKKATRWKAARRVVRKTEDVRAIVTARLRQNIRHERTIRALNRQLTREIAKAESDLRRTHLLLCERFGVDDVLVALRAADRGAGDEAAAAVREAPFDDTVPPGFKQAGHADL